MRYISVSSLAEGMELARPLYGANLGILLGGGVRLTRLQIQRIRELGYDGVYIQDGLSRDIEPVRLISDELRIEAVCSVRELLKPAGRKSTKIQKPEQERLVMPMIESIISAPRRLLDVYDMKPFGEYVSYHTVNVTVISLLIGVEMGLSGPQLHDLGLAALLHDVGYRFVPQDLLGKEEELSVEELEQLRGHTQLGFEYLQERYALSIEACMGALHHHENFNGTGYPARLSNHRISVCGRIVAVANAYDAMISRRPYREAMHPCQALEELRAQAGAMFDPVIVALLERLAAPYPAGTCVELNDGEQYIVLQNLPGRLHQPFLRPLGRGGEAAGRVDLALDENGAGLAIDRVAG